MMQTQFGWRKFNFIWENRFVRHVRFVEEICINCFPLLLLRTQINSLLLFTFTLPRKSSSTSLASTIPISAQIKWHKTVCTFINGKCLIVQDWCKMCVEYYCPHSFCILAKKVFRTNPPFSWLNLTFGVWDSTIACGIIQTRKSMDSTFRNWKQTRDLKARSSSTANPNSSKLHDFGRASTNLCHYYGIPIDEFPIIIYNWNMNITAKIHINIHCLPVIMVIGVRAILQHSNVQFPIDLGWILMLSIHLIEFRFPPFSRSQSFSHHFTAHLFSIDYWLSAIERAHEHNKSCYNDKYVWRIDREER